MLSAADSGQRLRCDNPTSVWTCVSTTKYRIRENHPDSTKKNHLKEIQQSSGFLAIKVNDKHTKTIKKEQLLLVANQQQSKRKSLGSRLLSGFQDLWLLFKLWDFIVPLSLKLSKNTLFSIHFSMRYGIFPSVPEVKCIICVSRYIYS